MPRSRRDNPDDEQSVRVRVFVNLNDFAQAWQFEHAKVIGKQISHNDRENALVEVMDVRWESLPEAILDQLDEMEYIGDSPKEMRAVDIYACSGKRNDADRQKFEAWLEDTLDPFPGFEVHSFNSREEKQGKCAKCETPLRRNDVIKGLNTKVACDLLSHAVNDSYDIAVLVMEDEEIVPSVLSVQDIFDKQIIHVGTRGRGDALRSAAWGNFLLEDLVPELVSPEDIKIGFSKKKKRS